MNRFLLVPLLVLALTGQAQAQSRGSDPAKWDTMDKALGVTALSLVLVDWGQTLYIADNPHLYREANVFLGEHPSRGRVNTYFTLVTVGGYFLADYLQGDARKAFLSAVSVIEIGMVSHNYHVGIRIGF